MTGGEILTLLAIWFGTLGGVVAWWAWHTRGYHPGDDT
jgi:hypothetical protein